MVPLSSVIWLFDFDPTTAGGVAAVEYAFGIRTDDGSIWFHIGVTPTAWLKVGSGSGGGGGSMVQAWTYTVTGSEPDLSEIVVSLPTPILAAYTVVPICQGCVRIVAAEIDNMTNTQFVVVGTGDFSTGDVIGFIATPNT